MSLIVNERWDRLKRRIRPRTWQAVKDKAQWEHMSLSAVVKEYPTILPKNLRRPAASCFVETRREWLEARRAELRAMLRQVERELGEKGTARMTTEPKPVVFEEWEAPARELAEKVIYSNLTDSGNEHDFSVYRGVLMLFAQMLRPMWMAELATVKAERDSLRAYAQHTPQCVHWLLRENPTFKSQLKANLNATIADCTCGLTRLRGEQKGDA